MLLSDWRGKHGAHGREAASKKLALFPSPVAIVAVTPSHLTCRNPVLNVCVFPMKGKGMNAIEEMLEEAVRIGSGAMFNQR